MEYKLREPEGDGSNAETYRLITTLLDPSLAEARELAELYPERWEIELTIKESKTILRKGQLTLRSKTAELARQEFWGLLLAHYLVQKMMAQAAGGRGIDPDTLSYDRSIEIIKSAQGCPTLETSKRVRNAVQANAISRIGEAKTVSSREMSKERTIRKKPRPSFPVRKGSQSRYADRFLLKGAMLFRIWTENSHRPTRDLDPLGTRPAEADDLAAIFREICGTSVEPDGLEFLGESVKASPIREGAVYGGIRVNTEARLGNVRVHVQTDVERTDICLTSGFISRSER